MVAALLPTALLAWYLSEPARNQPIVIRLEHFVITSNVSVVAALVAFLVARAALGVGHYRALLIALGFACMAAIFAVHGLSTPGVLQQGDREAPSAGDPDDRRGRVARPVRGRGAGMAERVRRDRALGAQLGRSRRGIPA